MTQTLHNSTGRRADQAGGNSTGYPRIASTEVSRVRQWIDRAIGTFARRDSAEDASRTEACSKIVRDACMLLRLGRIEEAEIVLQSIAERRPRHAGWLNLMGVIFESRGAWRWARRLYGKAMRAGRGFAPAEQNMRRCYELFTFGRTNLPVALGDD